MHILSDEEIVALLESGSPLLSNFNKPDNWYSADSLVQPSSLDLHIGQIYVPPKDEPKACDATEVVNDYILDPGQAIVVDTSETLVLPSNIAAFGFPPTSVSSRAILMTNPGHIDPGFQGKLNFTLINMGRKAFPVEKGDNIVTLLLIKLANPAKEDFRSRNPRYVQTAHSARKLYLIGRDFLGLDERTRKAAENAVRNEDLNIKQKQVWIPVLTAIFGGVLAFGGAWLQSKQAVSDVRQEVNELKTQMNLETRFKELETKIGKLSENTNAQKSSSTQKDK